MGGNKREEYAQCQWCGEPMPYARLFEHTCKPKKVDDSFGDPKDIPTVLEIEEFAFGKPKKKFNPKVNE